MGGSSYSYSSRVVKADSLGYATKSINDTFEQNKLRRIHDEMDPKGVTLRESRDSEIHPNSVPIIITLDLTGSMGNIPHNLVKDGLPKIMSGIIQNGIPDPQVMFLGVGDHECGDRAPFQISQFESGDEELDLWLTRTYIEGGGGGNAGESYSLAHYFAAKYCETDAWDKRNKKGFLFTIGDEASLLSYPKRVFSELFGDEQAQTYTDVELLKMAQEKWEVFHIMPGRESRGGKKYWDNLLGQNCIWVDSIDQIAQTIKDIVVSNSDKTEAKYEIDVEETQVKSEAVGPKIML